MTASRTIFVSAGEVSGDHYIARITRRVRDMGFDGEIAGLCGEESISAGAQGLWRAERLQILGISEAIGSMLDILSLKREMTDEIIARDPAALILVDSPDFNIPLARSLRKRGYGGRIYYISPPSVWAWRSGRVEQLKRYIDDDLPLFGFEHEYLLGAGCDSHWIGHPFVEEFRDLALDRAEIASRVRGRAELGRVVALLPGSRRSEISRLYPILREICGPLEREGWTPVVSVANGLPSDVSRDLIETLEREGRAYFTGEGRELMALSEAVVGSSGTATVQALLLRKMMVVLYKVSPISAMIGRRFLRNKFFAVPNLLADDIFFPELIQERAEPAAALEAILGVLGASEHERAEREARMEGLISKLGDVGVIDFWASRVLEAFR